MLYHIIYITHSVNLIVSNGDLFVCVYGRVWYVHSIYSCLLSLFHRMFESMMSYAMRLGMNYRYPN